MISSSKMTRFWDLTKFNLYVLIKSKAFIAISALFYLIPIIFTVICYILDISPLSISWIYLMVIGFFQLAFVNIVVYILYFINSFNTVDTFFKTKGYLDFNLLFTKLFSMFIMVVANSFVSTVFLIIFLPSFGFIDAMLPYSMMQFFGSILTSLFLFPIFLVFSKIKNKIIYSLLSIIFFLLPAASIVPRLHTNNISSFAKFDISKCSYLKNYNLETKQSIVFETVGENNSNKALMNNFLWSFFPAELMFSPLYYTYQVNNSNVSSDLFAEINFISNINNLYFDKTSSEVPGFSNSINLRALDQNIFELSEKELTEVIKDAAYKVSDYTYNQLNCSKQDVINFSTWSSTNSVEGSINLTKFEKLLNKMFFENDSTFYYIYLTQWFSEEMQSEKTDNAYVKYSDKFKRIIKNLENVPSEFVDFLLSCFNKSTKGPTILNYEVINGEILKNYPVFGNNPNASVVRTDVDYFISKSFSTSNGQYKALDLKTNNGNVDLSYVSVKNQTGIIDKTASKQVSFTDFWKQMESLNTPESNTVFVSNEGSVIQNFANDLMKISRDDVSVPENGGYTNPMNWDGEITSAWFYYLSGNDVEFKSSSFSGTISGNTNGGNYRLFNYFVEQFKKYSYNVTINQFQEEDKKNNTTSYLNIDKYVVDPNNMGSDSGVIYSSSGNLSQGGYNNILISSLIFGCSIVVAYIWIIYFAIAKSKTKND